MAEPQSSESNDRDTTDPRGTDEPPATPRWVKITGVVVALFAIAVLAKALLSGVGHEPGLHGGLGTVSPGTTTPPPAGVTALSRALPRR